MTRPTASRTPHPPLPPREGARGRVASLPSHSARGRGGEGKGSPLHPPSHRLLILPIICCCAWAPPGEGGQAWTHLAQGPARLALSAQPAGSITRPAWTASTDPAGNPISFVGPASVVGTDELVLALGSSAGSARLFAFRRASGAPAWATPVPSPFLDSWSSPAIDLENARAIVASADALTAIDLGSGAVAWQTGLGAPVVNASPLVTDDLGPSDRIFITTYPDGYSPGALVCVNADPFDPVANPFDPGEIVWSLPLSGLAGNTPAYAGGVVYLSANTDASLEVGRVLALAADALEAPEPLWTTNNPEGHPFFGGVLIGEDPCATPAVYAASFEFHAGLFSANLLKLRAQDGEVLWSVPSGRTDSIPILLPDGRIALSSGIPGFGSVPSLHLFQDGCDSATLLWDVASETWDDLDADGAMDPGEFLQLGGWNHQPALVAAPGAPPTLHVGSPPTGPGFFEPFSDLRAINLDLDPSDPGFVFAHASGAGSSPAVADASVFSVGPEGLVAFPPACPADCDADGSVNVLDFVCFAGLFLAGDPAADCTLDGVLNALDFICFQSAAQKGCP